MSKYHYTYSIKNIKNGMQYIGSRSCNCHPLEDTKYMGSSTNQEFIKALKTNPEHFIKTIIMMFDDGKEARKAERDLQIKFDVAKNPSYYNKRIESLNSCVGVDVQNNPEIRQKKSEAMKGEKNPCYGRTGELHPMFGHTGEKNHMYGKHHTPESNKKNSESHKGMHAGDKNPMFGRTGEKNPMSKPVMIVETGQIFTTLKECAEYLNLKSVKTIHRRIKKGLIKYVD